MLIINDHNILTEKFKNGETKVKDFDQHLRPDSNLLELKYENDGDIVLLEFAKAYIDEIGVPCDLFVWYMPYSRMDRKIEGDLFTLKYVCNRINSLNFNHITVMEPHSEKTVGYDENGKLVGMLKNAVPLYPVLNWLDDIKKEIGFKEGDHIVFPDKGAAARYANSGLKDVIRFKKKRDDITGKILDMYIDEGTVSPGSKCIIIDDLCSKGGTFAWAGSILKDAGASEVYLVVAHCEKTIFEGDILKDDSPINAVFTSTSMMDKYDPKIKYVDVF